MVSSGLGGAVGARLVEASCQTQRLGGALGGGRIAQHCPEQHAALRDFIAQLAQLGGFEHLVAHIERQATPFEEVCLLVDLRQDRLVNLFPASLARYDQKPFTDTFNLHFR